MNPEPLIVSEIAQLPDITSARLPSSYIEARQAIEKCARIDECQQWGDKAEALASYAKQADDDTLRELADRIQARAIKRCGQLLREYPSHTGAHLPNVTAPPSLSRTEAAEQAGLSERQRVTALRVANVPDDVFEELVESPNPATVTQLAEIGRKARPQPVVELGGRDPREFAISTQGQGILREFVTFAAAHDPAVIARGALESERSAIIMNVGLVRRWMSDLLSAMEDL